MWTSGGSRVETYVSYSSHVCSRLEANSATPGMTDCPLRDQLEAGRTQGGHELREGIDIPADHAVARLHPLNGREGQSGELSQLALVDSEQRPCGSKLGGGDHSLCINT